MHTCDLQYIEYKTPEDPYRTHISLYCHTHLCELVSLEFTWLSNRNDISEALIKAEREHREQVNQEAQRELPTHLL